MSRERPIFRNAYTPVYSNINFVLISVALERMSGVPFEELFNKKLVQAHALKATSYPKPPPVDEHAVVPGSAQEASWDFDLGEVSIVSTLRFSVL